MGDYMTQYISAAEAAERWGISKRRVQKLCSENRLHGAEKHGNTWIIPSNACKPLDARATRYKETDYSLPSGSTLTSIDLFSGPGGLATGFRWAGIKPLVAVEWSYWTARTYCSSHNAEMLDLEQYESNPKILEPLLEKTELPILIYGDINKVSVELIKLLLMRRYGLESVDIVTGGAPCESFSMAGDRKEEDDRNHLYRNVLRIARGVNSKMFLFENVKGLFSKKYHGKRGGMYQEICDDFESKSCSGYPSFRLVSRDKEKVLLKAIDYGVPQLRERLFLVGINVNYSGISFSYPKPSNGPGCDYDYVTVHDALGDLPPIGMGKEATKYTFNLDSIANGSARSQFLRRMRGDLCMAPEHINFRKDTISAHKAPGHTKKMLCRFKLIKQGESMKTAYERLIATGKTKEAQEYFPRKIYGARNRRLRSNEPSFTVTSHCLDEMVHPTANRGLTPREAARLQSFPDWYIFEGPFVSFHSDPDQDQYEQIGDAIPPLMAYALGCEIRKSCLQFNTN